MASPVEAPWVPGFVELIRARTGIHMPPHRQSAHFERLVRAACEAAGHTSPEGYLRALSREPLESDAMQALVTRVTNNESYFFRNPGSMDALRASFLPALVEKRRSARTLRIWSAACSTGEEVYSLAVLVAGLELHGWETSILGTDIDLRVLATGLRASYGGWSLRGSDTETIQRCFEPAAGRYEVRSPFRRGVSFRYHNLVEGEPESLPGPFDLVLCRNAAIYFDAHARERAYATLARHLAPDGLLLLGAADPAPGAPFQIALRAGFSAAYGKGAAEAVTGVRAALRPAVHSGAAGPLTAPALARTPGTMSKAPPFAPVLPPPVVLDIRPVTEPAPRATKEPPPARDGAPLEDALAEARRIADAGRLEEALACAAAIAESHPTSWQVHELVAMIEQEAGRLDRAEAALKRVLYLEPDAASAHLRLGLLRDARGETRQATRSLRTAASILLADGEGSGASSSAATGELRSAALGQLARIGRRRGDGR